MEERAGAHLLLRAELLLLVLVLPPTQLCLVRTLLRDCDRRRAEEERHLLHLLEEHRRVSSKLLRPLLVVTSCFPFSRRVLLLRQPHIQREA